MSKGALSPTMIHSTLLGSARLDSLQQASFFPRPNDRKKKKEACRTRLDSLLHELRLVVKHFSSVQCLGGGAYSGYGPTSTGFAAG